MNIAELIAGYSVLDRYMARRVPKSKSPELFDDEGNARWITIGGEPGADGKKHGGHPVKISGDGKMLTGKFAGQTMGEAFGDKGDKGDKKEPEKDSKPTEKKRWWHDKELLGVYNKWEEHQKSKTKKVALRPLSELLPEIRKRGSELENKRDTDEYDKAYREFHQQVRVGQQSLSPEDSQLLSKVFDDWFPAPDDYDEDKVVDLDKWRKENPEPRVVEPESKPEPSKSEPKQPEPPPGDGIPRISADQLGDGSNGTYDQMHAGLASEFVQSRIAKGMEGIENREYAIFQHPSGKWQMVSRKRQKADQIASKPAEQPNPTSQPGALSDSEPDPAASAFDKSISSGGTPREAAKAAQKKLDSDYEFARSSEIGNAGEDLKGSARHKRNQWRGLEQAEKDGLAAELITRDSLLKNEPHNLFIYADKNPLTALAMHYALKAFPPKPGTGKRGDHEKDRRQYLDAYQSVKSKAEELAKSKDSADVVPAIDAMRKHVMELIQQYRGQSSDDSIGRATATDRYNQTSNDLVNLHKALGTAGRVGSSSVAGKISDFSKAAKDRYGDLSVENIAEHVQDIMDGKSFNVTFGRDKKQTNRFDPSEMYVKIATRNGGRNLSGITSDANKATKHLVESMGLRGVQWGNSVTDDERKHHAARAVEALTDLADALGIHPKDIAIDGKLGLAIGARGRGGAVAHYEPSSNVINLTRAKGVGSLAHEWGHAFDHYLNGFNASKFMTQDTHTHEVTYDEKMVAGLGAAFKNWKSTTSNPEKMEKEGYKVTARSDAPLRKAFSELKTAQSDYRSRLNAVLKGAVKGGFMGEDKAEKYWNSEVEIFARTFERYVQHKIESTGNKNTYLAGIETKAHKFGGLWPTDAEVQAMAPAFDAIFEAYRQQKYGSPEKVKFSRSAAMQELMATWGLTSNIEQYARKSPKSSPGQMSFDDQDGGRWITIGSESGADGSKHGGHPVYIGKDGEMKTGKFAGQKLSEAFREKPLVRNSGDVSSRIADAATDAMNERREALVELDSYLIKPYDEARKLGMTHNEAMSHVKSGRWRNQPSKSPTPGITFDTRTNSAAKPNDQMGLFGDVANVPRGQATLPPGGESRGKQQSLFDTKGDPDQMLMFDDGVATDDRVMKFGQSRSIRDRAAELVKYWGLSAERLGERYSAPTDAQREAGNYPKKHIRLHGLHISIETAKGERRRPDWPPMPCDYGYIRGTVGKDKDHVDVFIGPNKESELVVVIDQVDQSGKFDEHKVLLGFSNEASAINQYKKAYTSDWKVGPVTTMTIGQFKSWLKDGSQNKPLERQVSKFSLRSIMVPA